jgi:ubiquitin-conjugating enzyme E2 variant
MLRWVTIFVATYVYTDILSGLLHVVLDNERSLEVPVIQDLARGFQTHHRNPSSIFTMTWYEHLYTMDLPLSILFVFIVLCGTPTHFVYFLSIALMLHVMQMSHRWAHLPSVRVPRTVKALQNVGLLLDANTHRLHHRGKYDINFCIMNGWLNPLLNMFINPIGRTNHAWIGIFLSVVLVPVGLAFL